MFAKGLLGYLPANLAQAAAGLLGLVLFTRLLAPGEFGAYVLALGASSLVYTVGFSWLEASMARFYPAERLKDPAAPALYAGIYGALAGLSLLFLSAAAVVALAEPLGAPAFRTALAAGLVSAPARSFVKIVQEQRRSEGRVASAAALDISQSLGGLLAGLALAALGWGAAAPLAGQGVAALAAAPLFGREDVGRALRGRPEPARLGQFARYGFPVSAGGILNIALYSADRFLIAGFLGPAAAGAYHAGFSIASRIIDILFIWFGAAGEPALVYALETSGPAGLRRQAERQVAVLALVLAPATAGLITVGPTLADLFMGAGLRAGAVAVLPLVTLGAFFSGAVTYYFLLPFILARRTGRLLAAMAVAAAANVALNLLLIPGMGLKGAALAFCLSNLLAIAAAVLLAGRVGRLPFPLRPILGAAAAATLMAAALARLPSFGGAADLVVRPAVGVGIYGVLVLVLDIAGARSLVRRLLTRFVPGGVAAARAHGARAP